MPDLREQTSQELRRTLLERQSKHRVPAVYGAVAVPGRVGPLQAAPLVEHLVVVDAGDVAGLARAELFEQLEHGGRR